MELITIYTTATHVVEAKEALRKASHKLPIHTRLNILHRPGGVGFGESGEVKVRPPTARPRMNQDRAGYVMAHGIRDAPQ